MHEVSVGRRALLAGLGCGVLGAWPGAARADKSSVADRSSHHDDGQPAYLTFEMQVSWSTTIALQTFITDLLSKHTDEIHLLISSTGGDVSAAIACYNFLRSLDVQISTYNLGDVDSAAIILFLAGQKRQCSPTSRFLFHPATAHIQDQTMSNDDYKDNIADLQSDVDRIKAIYTAGTRIDDKKAEYLLSRQNWVDPKAALDMGVVDNIEPLKIPSKAAISVLPVPEN